MAGRDPRHSQGGCHDHRNRYADQPQAARLACRRDQARRRQADRDRRAVERADHREPPGRSQGRVRVGQARHGHEPCRVDREARRYRQGLDRRETKAATKGKPAAKPQPTKAAAPVKTANSEVGAAAIKAAADMIAAWKPADHEGITQADARELARKWLSYLPTTATWDKRLGERSDAGRRRSRSPERREPRPRTKTGRGSRRTDLASDQQRDASGTGHVCGVARTMWR